MSFGFGAGDIVTCCTLALKVYNSLSSAPDEFDSLRLEILGLQLTLKAFEHEELSPTSLIHGAAPARRQHMQDLIQRCTRGLAQLEVLLARYPSLAPGNRRKFVEYVGFASKDKQGPRGRLAVHTAGLSLFLTSLTQSAIGRMEFLLKHPQGVTIQQRTTNINLAVNVGASQKEPDKESDAAWIRIGQDLAHEGITGKDAERFEAELKAYLRYLVSGEVPFWTKKASNINDMRPGAEKKDAGLTGEDKRWHRSYLQTKLEEIKTYGRKGTRTSDGGQYEPSSMLYNMEVDDKDEIEFMEEEEFLCRIRHEDEVRRMGKVGADDEVDDEDEEEVQYENEIEYEDEDKEAVQCGDEDKIDDHEEVNKVDAVTRTHAKAPYSISSSKDKPVNPVILHSVYQSQPSIQAREAEEHTNSRRHSKTRRAPSHKSLPKTKDIEHSTTTSKPAPQTNRAKGLSGRDKKPPRERMLHLITADLDDDFVGDIKETGGRAQKTGETGQSNPGVDFRPKQRTREIKAKDRIHVKPRQQQALTSSPALPSHSATSTETKIEREAIGNDEGEDELESMLDIFKGMFDPSLDVDAY